MKSSTSTFTEFAERIRRIENEILSITIAPDQPPMNLDLQSLMELFKVPGISVAIIDQFEIAWAKGYGVTEVGTNNPVTSDTLFESGSISKPVAAVGALALVQQGKLSLDEDVNQKLKSWKVPENEFTGEQKVTLRLPPGLHPKKAHLLAAQTTPHTEHRSSQLTVTVPSILDHEIVAIET